MAPKIEPKTRQVFELKATTPFPLWNAKSSVSGRTFSGFLVPVLGPNKGTSDDAEIGHPLSKSYKEVPI